MNALPTMQLAGRRLQPSCCVRRHQQVPVSRAQIKDLRQCRRSVGVATRAQGDDSKGGSAAEGLDVPTVNPRIYLYFLAANLSVYAAGVVIALTVSNDASNEFFMSLAKVNSDVAMGEYWRLLTANFMHAGFLHLGLNCVALYMLAPQAEAALGYYTFSSIYVLSGLSGSIASYLTDDLVTVGASGAIFGVLGALTAYWVRNPMLERRGQQLLIIAAILGVNVVLGLDADGLVDNTGHLGGFAAGFGLGWAMTPVWRLIPERSAQTAAAAAALEAGWQADAAETAPSEGSAGGAPASGSGGEGGSDGSVRAAGADGAQGGDAQGAGSASGSGGEGEGGTGAPPQGELTGSAALIDLLGAMTNAAEEAVVPEVLAPRAPAPPVAPKVRMKLEDGTAQRTRYIATAAFLVALAVATVAGTGVDRLL